MSTQAIVQSPISTARVAGAAYGAPNLILRFEGAAALATSLAAYARWGDGWLVFVLLFLTPDLAMLGYLGGRRIGAAAYNAAHSYVGPAALAGLALTLHAPQLLGAVLIWTAHIGFDRLLGFGLKYETAFGHTHLGGPKA